MSQFNKEIRQAAKAALKGRWGRPILACIIITALAAASMLPYEMHYVDVKSFDALTVALLAAGLAVYYALGVPFGVGLYDAMRRLRTPAPDGSGGYDPDGGRVVANAFSTGFANWAHNVLGFLLMAIVNLAFTLLLIVPGVIRSIEYMCVPFILTEEPQLGLRETLAKSRRMMRGHRLEWFLMELGFVGMVLGSIVALYIPLLWIAPFVYAVSAEFYARVKAGYENGNNKTEQHVEE